MRRLISSMAVGVAMTMSLVGRAQAQTPLNVVAGPVFANVSTDDWETSSRTRFFVAAGTAIGLSETFSVDPYLAYVQKGASFDNGGEDSYDYIEIPVFLTASLPMGETAVLALSAGPAIGFNIKCEEVDGFDCSDYGNFKSTEVSIVGGASVGFPLTDTVGLALGGGVDWGLSEVFTDEGDYKNRSYYLFASLGFALGGGM